MKKLLIINQKNSILKIMLLLLVIWFFYHPLIAENNYTQADIALKKSNAFKNINIDSVLYYANSAYTLAKNSNLPKIEYASLIILAKANIKIGKYGIAISNLQKAKKVVIQNEYSELEVEMLIGTSYLAMGFINDALKFFLETQSKVTHKTKFKLQIDLDYYLGSAYSEINDMEKADKYLKSSIAIATSNNYSLGAYKSYILLTVLTDNLDTINKYNNLANNVIIKYPELHYKKVVLRNNQALINRAIGNLDLCKTQYLESISISIDKGFKNHLSNLFNNYAYLLMAEKKFDSVAIVLDKAMEIAKTINSADLQASIYDSYSDYFSSINDYKNALVYQDSFLVKREQYREEKRIQESLFLSVVFETEKKEKEILEQENKINRMLIFQVVGIASLIFVIGLVLYFRQKFQLSKSRLQTVRKDKELEVSDAMVKGQDSERERIAMDLHDGLGAKLSAMRFLADGFFSSNEKYNELSDFITNIHQNIRELSHRLKPTQLKSLGLPATINGMVATINKSEKFIVDFKTNIDRRLSDKLELNIYYIINELINNATKHSSGNAIFIQLYEEDNKIISLTVEDNGSGFNPKKAPDGLGLQNIKSRVEYLGGTLFIESSGTETNFMIEIPI